MTIYSLTIFDRHCTAIYYQDWHRSPLKPARPGSTVLPCVSPAVSPPLVRAKGSNLMNSTSQDARPLVSAHTPVFSSRTGIDLGGDVAPESIREVPHGVAEWKEAQERDVRERARKEEERRVGITSLPFDEEAKLVYGVVFSLRNMAKKLSGRLEEHLHSYSTSTYTLHLLHTPSAITFVLMTSVVNENLRDILLSIWKGAWIDFVVRNPLLQLDSNVSGRGVDNEHFRRALDTFMRGLPFFG